VKKVVIVGAPRSGTNMLRDVLTSFEGVATWPCDEINYIWRHKNISYPSDEFTVEMAAPSVCRYIRNKFNWVERQYAARAVIEKTCANSLRVDFVNKVLPDAKYIFIYRDGLDVIGSAKLRWTAELDIPYLLQKTRFVPLVDLPVYASRYFGNRLYRLFSKEKRLAFWGPRLDGMEQLLKEYSLEQICAIQWQRCVEKAEDSFSEMPSNKVIKVAYEKLVTSPVSELGKILSFLDLTVDEMAIQQAVAGVSSRSVGKGRLSISDTVLEAVNPLIEETMKRYGYQ